MYAAEWQEYRSLRLQMIGAWVGYAPAVGLFTLVEQRLTNSFMPCTAFAVLWMVLFLVTGARFNRFTCPRCRKTFAGRWWYTLSYLAYRCQHCGLGKFDRSAIA